MTDLSRALRDVVLLLDELKVPYVVMGGIAVRVYGIPRPTHDVDFTLGMDRDRLPELYAEIANRGYTVPEEYRKGWIDQVAGMPLVKLRLYLQDRGIDIDIFLAESRFQRELLSRRRRAILDGTPVWLVSPEDLILLKLLAGRPRDIADVADVLFTQGELDRAYLRTWARELGIVDQLEKALSEAIR
jgi:predicted nucleotidyltransferase